MDKLRAMIEVRRIDRMKKEKIKELVGVCEEVNKVINKSTMRCYRHMKRINCKRVVMKVFEGELTGLRNAGRRRKK